MTVASIQRDKGNTIISVLAGTPLMELVNTVASRPIGAVLVLDEAGKLADIVSERDVVKALAAKGPELHAVNAGDVMTLQRHHSCARDDDQRGDGIDGPRLFPSPAGAR